jgi:hypothetical protein
MEVDGFGSSSGEGIEGGGGKRGEARKGAFFIGFLEGEAKAAGRGRPPDSGVVACLFLESIAATKAAAQLIPGFACFHTATTTGSNPLAGCEVRGEQCSVK